MHAHDSADLSATLGRQFSEVRIWVRTELISRGRLRKEKTIAITSLNLEHIIEYRNAVESTFCRTEAEEELDVLVQSIAPFCSVLKRSFEEIGKGCALMTVVIPMVQSISYSPAPIIHGQCKTAQTRIPALSERNKWWKLLSYRKVWWLQGVMVTFYVPGYCYVNGWHTLHRVLSKCEWMSRVRLTRLRGQSSSS